MMKSRNNYLATGNILNYWLMPLLLVAGMMTHVKAATYYSQSGGILNLNDTVNWNSLRTGGTAATRPISSAFTTANNIFVIQGTGNGGTSPHQVESSIA